uniref:Uncharacterized protein n=1 Tax=Meloidogyne hapla TaxID=6305 RepID=A0A1I8BUN9_MELHA
MQKPKMTDSSYNSDSKNNVIKQRNEVQLTKDKLRRRAKLQTIYNHQKILFGDEVPKRELYLNYKVQEEIFKNYEGKNCEFQNCVKLFIGKKEMTKENLVIVFMV